MENVGKEWIFYKKNILLSAFNFLYNILESNEIQTQKHWFWLFFVVNFWLSGLLNVKSAQTAPIKNQFHLSYPTHKMTNSKATDAHFLIISFNWIYLLLNIIYYYRILENKWTILQDGYLRNQMGQNCFKIVCKNDKDKNFYENTNFWC